MPLRPPLRHATLGCLLLVVLHSGCESPVKPPQLQVQAARATPMGDAATTTRYYNLRYVNSTTQTVMRPLQQPLLDALAREGYHPAVGGHAPDTVVWIAAMENITQEVEVDPSVGQPMSGNQDSVRHRNVAGLMGRYRQLLTDNRNSGGQMILGPEGEVIMTGSLGDNVTDEAHFEPNIPTRTVLRRRHVLAVWATETRPPTSEDDTGELWRVEVMSDSATDETPPEFRELVNAAITHLGQNTNGLKDVPLPALAEGTR